jgi:2-dehydro-3-deoxyphosphooctonate aldolase (KDO 8-P synthase)
MNQGPSTLYPVNVGTYTLKSGSSLFLIAGPCVLESEELAKEVALELERIRNVTGIPVIFKASYDKANRTSADSFRGPGIEKGLQILSAIRSMTGLPIISDIHTPEQAALAGKVLDILQIPAFLCRQTDLLLAAGRTGKAVNVKKGQFQAPGDMDHVLRKVLSTGNSRILITERGTSFGYRDLVADMRSIVIMKGFGFPVVFDATHSVQSPGAGDGRSSGDRTLVGPLARAAVAAGADGVFMEVHPCPDRALCDGPNSLPLGDLESLIRQLNEIHSVVCSSKFGSKELSPQLATDDRDSASASDKLRNVRLIVFDVDGVLTDGRITFGSGDLEIKSFNVRDGHGIKIAMRTGLDVALITGRESDIVLRRAKDLGISRVYQAAKDKTPILEALINELSLTSSQVAVVGDDVVDIPIMRRVGVSFAVPEAPAEVLRAATFVTNHPGGKGAAREVIEMVLKAQGKWQEAMSRYFQ